MDTLPKFTTIKIENQNKSNQPKNKGFKDFLNANLTEVIGSLVILSLILFGGSIWNTWTAYRGFKDNITKEFKLQDLSGQIVHLDEVLTMSARLAASTGETRWENRYNNFVTPLDTALKNIIKLAPSAIEENTTKTDQANLKLVEMETKAFQLVRAGKSKEALELLLGKEYEDQKQIYSQGINTTLSNIKESIDKDIALYSQRLRNSVIFAGITLPILVISWSIIFWLIKSYISDRQKALNELSNSQKELLQLNNELENTSQKIIEQEQITQQENELLQTDVSHLLDVVSLMEEGDLTINAEVNDRLTGLVSDTLNRLLEQLREIINQVIKTTEKVTTGTTKLEDVALNTATQIQEQTELIVECEQLIGQVAKLSQDTLEQELVANKAIKNAQTAVKNGEQKMNTMTVKMVILQEETELIVTRVNTLTDFVDLASKFSKDQKKLAALTRVLALNASMIATRASQQQDPEQFMSTAREFETIARQVNDLAVETNENLLVLQQRTDKIKTVVSGLNQDTEDINNLVKDFTLGLKESYQMFQEISKITNQIVEVEEEVMKSSHKITDLTTNTLNSIENISKIAQTTEQEMKITLAQTNTMNTLAFNLLEIIKFFRTN